MYENFLKRTLFKDLLEEKIKSQEKEIENKTDKLKAVLNDIEHYKLAYACLEKIIETANRNYISKIEKMLNKAIQSIFIDENYKIEVITENKKLNFQLSDLNNLDEDDNPLQINIEDACGGGIITVIGFTLQLFIIELLKLNKIIFIDEGFMALSENYRPLFYNFINEFCENTGTKILIVSHDEMLKENAMQILELEHGVFKK